MNLVRHPSLVRNVLLAMLIIPISFAANTIRIIFLSLITYHFGDAAGQGFLHGFSGLVLFLSALLLIIGVDSALSWMVRRGGASDEGAGLQLPALAPGAWAQLGQIATRPAVLLLAGMLLAVGGAWALTPKFTPNPQTIDLAASVPTRFGDWRELQGVVTQAELSTAEDGGRSLEQPYDDVLMRTYVNKIGRASCRERVF